MSTHHAPAPSRRGRYEAAEPREADAYEDWDDWDEEVAAGTPESRVLWGRLAVFAAALILAFFAGRMTAGSDDAALAASQERIADLTAELEQRRAELDAVQAGGTGGSLADNAGGEEAAQGEVETSTDAAAESAEGGEPAGGEPATGADAAAAGAADAEAANAEAADSGNADTAAADGEPYTVEAGDNLYGLAEEFYGDGQQWRLIAEANNLPAGAVLNPGQEIIIPAAP